MAKNPLKRASLVLALSLLPSMSWALPSPKDITEQMSAGNTAQAETLTREILHERPDSAKAHYYLGQILTSEGKYKDAYAELTKAAELDSSLSFASSEARFRGEMRKVEINLGKVSAPTASNETHAGRTMAIVLAFIAVIGGIAWLVTSRLARKDKDARAADRQKELAEQTARIMTLLDKAASLEVTVKLSDDPGKKLAALAGVKDELNDLLTKNRKQKELATDWSLTRIERSLRQIETGETVPPLSRPRPFKPQPQASVQPQAASSQPQVTNNYITGGSNDGLVEGMILGEMMSGRNETQVERLVERQSEPDRSSLDDSSSSFDSGSSSSFDSGSDSSFDSGGSSSDSGGGSDW